MASTKSKSRKRKRSISSANPRSYSQMYKDDTKKPERTAKLAPRAVEPTAPQEEEVNWRDEYAYVLRDLRTLFIVSFVIFVAMIGAGLFI